MVMWLIAAWLVVGSVIDMVRLSQCAPDDQSSKCSWFSRAIASGLNQMALVVGILLAVAATIWELLRSQALREPRIDEPPR